MADNKYDKLERIRADIQKDREKVAKMQEQIKQKEAKLKEAEATQIVADVGAMNMSPEQLGEFLALIQSGKLEQLLGGTGISPISAANVVVNNNDSDAEDEDDMEDIEDEEN